MFRRQVSLKTMRSLFLAVCLVVLFLGDSLLAQNARFIRADANADGSVNIADTSFLANFIFGIAPATPPPCKEAADANGDGGINIADTSFVANFIFGIAPASMPPAPFPDCGSDPDNDNLDCVSYPACAEQPPSGQETTRMLKVLTENGKAFGIEYSDDRPDPISPGIIEQTELLLAPDVDPGILEPFMRVRVLDANNLGLVTYFVEDPISGFREVPLGVDVNGEFDPENAPQQWIRLDDPSPLFLLSIPDIAGAEFAELTRFGPSGEEIDAGVIDLNVIFANMGRSPYARSDAEHSTIIRNGPSSSLADILILADGYDNTNDDREKFNEDVQKMVAFLWTIPLYNELRAGFNVHTAYVPSMERGGGNDSSSLKDTPYQSFFNCNSVARLVCVSGDGSSFAFDVARDAPGNYGSGSVDSIAILVNDSRYGGGGGSLMTVSTDRKAPEVFSHEFGHTVVGLADEYESEYNDGKVISSRTNPNISGEVAMRSDLKWISLVSPATAIPTSTDSGTCRRNSSCFTSPLPAGTVGMYEGGGYTACESYRPSSECQMRCYVGFFCAVCRKAYEDRLGGAVPLVDVYMRDNTLDVGNTPSPNGAEDPPGSGNRVRPWQSVDIVVDSQPFFDPASPGPSENATAGIPNRVYVTVHNRGRGAGVANVPVELYYAGATNGAPPFPGFAWIWIGTETTSVPGNEGSSTVRFDWTPPVSLPEHTCLIAIADPASDPVGTLRGGLVTAVRNNNNITWKNIHIFHGPRLPGDISNFDALPAEIVFRTEARDLPIGSQLKLTVEVNDGVEVSEFDPNSLRAMPLVEQGEGAWVFQRQKDRQIRFSLRMTVPGALKNGDPFQSFYSLDVETPVNTPQDAEFNVVVEQVSVNPQTGILGDPLGGNTWKIRPNALPPGSPDLVVEPFTCSEIQVNCDVNGCKTTVSYIIKNIGTADAGPYSVAVLADPNGASIVETNFPGLAAGEAQVFSATTPLGENCFDPDCTACVVADTNNTVAESDETNNSACFTCGG